MIIPLRETHSIVTCSCKGIDHSISDTNNPSIGQETNKRQWRGRVVVLDGDAGASEFYQGENREISVVHFVQAIQQRENDEAKYIHILRSVSNE